MRTSETARESSAIRLKPAARSSLSGRAPGGASSGLTASEPCGGTSWDIRCRLTSRLISVDDVIHRRLLHLPTAAVTVVARESEAVPVLVVEFRMVSAVVIARPARLLPEQRVLCHALRG